MKKVLAFIIVLVNFSCQEGLLFNQDVDIIELKTKEKPFDLAIDRRVVGLMTNGIFTYASFRKNYYDSSRLSEKCLYAIKSENLLLKINNSGEIVSSHAGLPLSPNPKIYRNRVYFLNENYVEGLVFNLQVYDETLNLIQTFNIPLTSYVKGGYNGFYRSNVVFQSENEFVISGNLSRNMNNSTSFFVARIKDGKLIQYQQSTEIIDGTITVMNGVLVNQNEIVFLGFGGVNISTKYRLYRFNIAENTLKEEFVFLFGSENESYLGVERINSTSVTLIPMESYPKSLNFKNDGIQIYDFERKIHSVKPFRIDGISSSILSVKGYETFDGVVYIDAMLEQGRTIIKLIEDGTGQEIFRRQTDFGKPMYLKNARNEVEMIEIGDIDLPGNRSKSVFVRHLGLDKFSTKTLFESISYTNFCFN